MAKQKAEEQKVEKQVYELQYLKDSLIDGFYGIKTSSKNAWMSLDDIKAEDEEQARKKFWAFINQGEGKLGKYRLLDPDKKQLTQN